MAGKQRIANALLLAALFLALLSPSLASAREVISNSADWQDVYSTIMYGNLGGANPHFLTGTAHGPILLYELPKNSDRIEIITSADKPYYVGYAALMQSRGMENAEELIFDSINLELAKRLTGINQFIIIDDAYGYNALSVAPYAVRAKYYVLFANTRNIDDVVSFLSTRQAPKIIIYGHLNRAVRSRLSTYNPEVINSDTGSRFQNNMLMLDKFAQVGSTNQVILTNGEFIEASMMTGIEPVLFIGKNNVPPEVKEYINKSGIQIGVLIGNELIGTATDIRRQVGISVFVKFARGARVPGGTISPVEDLDRFPMPSYRLSISIDSVSYNRATGQLEVTYRNNADLATYLKTTLTIKDGNGETIVVDGDNDTVFLDGGETKTIIYSRLGSVEPEKLQGNLSAEVYTIYGESKTSLENALRGTFPIEMIDIKDDAQIEIRDLYYDKSSRKFYVTIENVGAVNAYVSIELTDLWIDGTYVTLTSDEIAAIEPGKKVKIPVTGDLADEDLTSERNKKVNVKAIFGERKHALIKIKTAQFDLVIRTFNIYQYAIALTVVVLLILLFLFLGRRGKKCERCRTKNDSDARVCKKCGHELGQKQV